MGQDHLELRGLAIQMVAEAREHYSSDLAATQSVAGKLGVSIETLQYWLHEVEVDHGAIPRTTLGLAHSFTDHPDSWQHLLELLPDGIAFIDELGVIRYLNSRLAALAGYPVTDLVGEIVDKLVPHQYRDDHFGHRAAFAQHPSLRAMGSSPDLTLLRRDGSELAVNIALNPLVVGNKPWVVAVVRDDTARRLSEKARIASREKAAKILAESEERFRLAFENNVAGMVITDMDGCFVDVNRTFCDMLGYSSQEVLGRAWEIFTNPEDIDLTREMRRRLLAGEVGYVSFVKRYLHKDGHIVFGDISIGAIKGHGKVPKYLVASVKDVTEELALSEQLSHQALHDPLTGLANRALFEDRLLQGLRKSKRQNGWIGVLLLDLDDFKGVNDTLGHQVGDQLLIALARRLEKVIRSSDTLCRFGGDEFLYLAEDLASAEEAEAIANRLLDVLVEPFRIDGVSLEQHLSIGIVTCSGGATTDCSGLIQDADTAMYEAKRRGKGHYVVFRPPMRQQSVNRFELAQELRKALSSGQLSMYYQPIVNLSSMELVGFESLMRWQHAKRGWVPPDVFIAVAERSDLIFDLGNFALCRSTDEAKSWSSKGIPNGLVYVAVNLSTRQFYDPNLLKTVKSVLADTTLAPERLVVEITESIALADIDLCTKIVGQFRELGISIALDDFGTGYSSLAYLAMLHPDIIKIDRSFVNPSKKSRYARDLLEGIISLGRKLKMTVLAEGIETREQLELLQNLGCDLGQGYLFSPAVPSSEVLDIVSAERYGEGSLNSTINN